VWIANPHQQGYTDQNIRTDRGEAVKRAPGYSGLTGNDYFAPVLIHQPNPEIKLYNQP
jgi:hypothetical protein